jgi:pilus assembly protein CpaE
VLDTSHSFTDISLTALDLSDDILLVSTVELPTIKNIKIGLDIMQTLNYPKDKIKLILNRASEQYGVKYRDIEQALDLEIFSYIPEDISTIVPYANKGFPFILARSEKKVSKSIDETVGLLLGRKQKADVKWGILNFFI